LRQHGFLVLTATKAVPWITEVTWSDAREVGKLNVKQQQQQQQQQQSNNSTI